MATQQVDASPVTSSNVSEAFQAVSSYHPGESVAPYIDARDAAGLLLANGLNAVASVVQGSFTTDADSATDGLDVNLPFAPKFVILHNLTDSLLYIKYADHPADNSLKGTLGTPAWAVTASTIKMASIDDSSLKAFSLNAAEIAAAGKVCYYVAFA